MDILAVLEAECLTKSYRARDRFVAALQDVNLTIKSGEVVMLRGRSGSGKTTLLNVVGLLTYADSGTLRIGGSNAMKLRDSGRADLRARSIGMIFQAFNLLPHLTALENVALPSLASRAETDRRARSLFVEFGVIDRLNHRPGELSAGEQQRVAIARAMINRPVVLLADEPTGNLDAENEELVLGLLRDAARQGCGVLVVSHSGTVVAQGDRILTLDRGRLEEMSGECQ